MCFEVHKTTLEQELTILTTMYLVSLINTDSWRAGKGDLQRAFPLDVLMVPSYVITVAADGEHLTCGGLSLSKTVRHGNFMFITDYIDGLSLSPRRGDTGVPFMGSTHRGAPTLQQAIIENSTKEFLMMPSGEGSFSHPSPRRHGTGVSLAPVTTTTRMENAPAARAMMMIPPWTVAPQLEIGLRFERHHAYHEG
jgi:hypothetical protein